MSERETKPTADEIVRVCRYIAEMAHAMGLQSGSSALEIAGTTVSVCAFDPQFASAFAQSGNGAIVDSADGVYDAKRNGCLSYRAINGQILTPAAARPLDGSPNQ